MRKPLPPMLVRTTIRIVWSPIAVGSRSLGAVQVPTRCCPEAARAGDIGTEVDIKAAASINAVINNRWAGRTIASESQVRLSRDGIHYGHLSSGTLPFGQTCLNPLCQAP
ncbi:hypothetical protein Acor_06140 [Acrocarpospora corrugata]|uniref:Uncharacterized protein n=1 Tax=Acrocarpospora corrugata TaxID=35763 RepID=A0A5M3VTY9_9ACTN|nr:hypothetical protein Acor_06140 [Acrocarpospora corrugata]